MIHQPFKVTINDHQRASRLKAQVQMGHYFAFVKHPKVIGVGRLKRLRVDQPAVNEVLPLVDQPVELDGITITPAKRNLEPISCIVSDRDLYHAQQDVVHLFIVCFAPPDHLSVNIECHGEVVNQLLVQLTHGVGIETLTMRLPGRYQAQLLVADCPIGTPVCFTVTQYAVPPLSARLLSYRLQRAAKQLWFELAVESDQKPFTDELLVTLVAKDQEVAQLGLTALSSTGHYAGGLPVIGSGPFSLRLRAANDPARTTEIALWGQQQTDRPTATVVSELGRERGFAVRAEPEALPLRGGYLTAGTYLATPLTVAEVVTEQRLIQINADMASVVLLSFDLTTGHHRIQPVGNVTAGDTITVGDNGPISLVFIGGFVEGQPFEGYTTFFRPTVCQLTVAAPQTLRSSNDLVVQITCDSPEHSTVPVLLSVRDTRMTAIEKPAVNLAMATKRGLVAMTDGMDEDTFTTLNSHLKYGLPIVDIDSVQLDIEVIKWVSYGIIEKYRVIPLFKRGDLLFIALSDPINHEALQIIEWVTHLRTEPILIEDSKITKTIEIIGELLAAAHSRSGAVAESDAVSEVANGLELDDFDLEVPLSTLLQSIDQEVVQEEWPVVAEGSVSDDQTSIEALTVDNSGTEEELAFYLASNEAGYPVQTHLMQQEAPIIDADSQAVLFYQLVPVAGTQTVVIPLSSEIAGTYQIEAFAVNNGDWIQAQTTVVIMNGET